MEGESCISPSHFSQSNTQPNDLSPPSKTNKSNSNVRVPKRKNTQDDNILIETIKNNHLLVTQKLDHLMKEQAGIATDVSTLKSDNVQIKSQLAANSKNITSLNVGQADMTRRLNELEQKSIALHMEISGIRLDLVQPPADIKLIVFSLFDSYKIEYASADIDKVMVRFIKQNNVSVPIVTVVFSNLLEKLHIMKRKKELDPDNADKIYFSHALTPFNRNLFAKARHAGKEMGIRFVFVADGRVFLRDEFAPRGTCVRTIEELEAFKRSYKKPNLSAPASAGKSD